LVGKAKKKNLCSTGRKMRGAEQAGGEIVKSRGHLIRGRRTKAETSTQGGLLQFPLMEWTSEFTQQNGRKKFLGA